MTLKVKLIVFCLALAAIVSMHQLFVSVDATHKVAAILGASEETEVPEAIDDIDNDGLSNTEESYWNTDIENPDTDGDGFKDGEEVVSGHDPLKPGPNDHQQQTKNITRRTADIVVAGLTVGDLNPQSPNYAKSVSDVAFTVVQDFYNSQPTIPNLAIIATDATKENQEQYLNFLGEVIKGYLLDLGLNANFYGNLVSNGPFFSARADLYKKAYDTLSLAPVPENWRDAHVKILDLLKRIEINFRHLAAFNDDPFKAVLAVQEIQKNIGPELKLLLQGITGRIQQEGLHPSDTFYTILQLLNP